MTHPEGEVFYRERLAQINENRGIQLLSVVTDVVVHVDLSGREDPEIYQALTETQQFAALGGKFQMLDTGIAGGRKAFQTDVYAGAFNYLNIDALIYWFSTLPWEPTDCAMLSFSTEGEEFGQVSIHSGVVKASDPGRM